MLIPLNDIILIYEQMLQQLNIDYVSVIIYTSTDIDALCSLKMLSKFLKSENIQYKVYPVTTYTELQQRVQDSREYEKVRLFMFLNCGGLIDLSEKWFAVRNQNGESSNRKVILFDVNKPVHHKNVESEDVFHALNQILVIDDDHSELKDRITSEDLQKLEQLNEIDIQEGIESQQEPDNPDQSPKRNPKTHLTQRLKKHKQLIQQKYSNYYSTTFFSLPTSYCLYRLTRELNKANNYMLWYGIVGITSMYLQGNISRQILQFLTGFYRSDMVRFNATVSNAQKHQKGQIFTKKGYQFPLMNHWSLYQSMMNSPYMMSRLGLWNDKGITKLHQILTKIGISLQQSKQQYKYMFKQMKQSLQQKLFAAAEEYNLVQITYESFMCQVDNSSAYMASDYYYLITAILQRPIHKSTFQELSQHRLDCFWSAYSLLDGSQEMIKRGLEEYKEISGIMMREIKDIIERDSVIAINGRVNFCNIRCDTKEKRLFEHPSVLIRLANMLMRIQRQRKTQQSKKSVSAIPCLVSLLDQQKNISLLVGVVPQQKNDMGNRFNVVVEKLKIPVTHDRFLSNVIMIPQDSMIHFVKEVGNLRV